MANTSRNIVIFLIKTYRMAIAVLAIAVLAIAVLAIAVLAFAVLAIIRLY